MLRRTEAALIGDEEGSRVFTVTSHKGTRFWHAGSPAVDSSGICFGCRNHLARSFPSWATLLWKLSIAAYKMLAQVTKGIWKYTVAYDSLWQSVCWSMVTALPGPYPLLSLIFAGVYPHTLQSATVS